MALFHRAPVSRHYAIATGVLFVMGAVVVAVLSLIAPRTGVSRLVGLGLAALLGARGMFRIRGARALTEGARRP